MRIVLAAAGLVLALNATALPGSLPGAGADAEPRLREADRLYRQGLSEIASGRLDAAANSFQAARSGTGTVYPLLGLAEVALFRKDLAGARTLVEEAQAAQPEDADVLDSLGRLLILEREFDSAESALRTAVEKNPGLLSAQMALGDLYQSVLQRPDDAITCYRAVIEHAPEDPTAHYALGLALRGQGIFEAAETHLRAATRLDPGNPLPPNALAELEVTRERYDEALATYDAITAAHPNFLSAYSGRARIYLARRDPARAAAEFESLARLDPRDADAWFNLGLLRQLLEDRTAAERAYLEAVAVDPDRAVAWNNLAWMRTEAGGDLEEALTWAERAVALEPGSPDYLDTLAWVHRSRGEFGLALDVLGQAQSRIESPVLLYHRGVICMEKGEPEQAAAALSRALDLDPGFAYAADARALLERIRSGGR